MKKTISFIAFAAVVAVLVWIALKRKSENRVTNGEGHSLIFNLNSDNTLHFAWLRRGEKSEDAKILANSEMVVRPDSASSLEATKEGWENDNLILHVDRQSLCFTVIDKKRGYETAQFCPRHLGQKTEGLSIKAAGIQNVYGLGEQFLTPGQFDGDWMGKVRDSGQDPSENKRGQHYGNNMHGFNGGAVGNATFPILFAVGAENKNFAFFFDNTYKQRWDFTAPEWKVETSGGPLRGYVMVGADLPSLRAEYMDLTGRPPVPPKKAFGLWVSEYGFENWGELEGKLKTLRQNKFPVDGFVMDLQWFGGIKKEDDNSAMGGLTWDTAQFPNPQAKIASLKKDENIGLIVIEEPYISLGVKDPASGKTVHEILEEKGYLATEKPDKGAKAALIAYNPWWGRGGIFDYANEDAAKFWHDFRRQPLVEMGVTGHWTDLGEPEMFEPEAFYDNGRSRHPDIHNVYNLRWSKSIYEGYARHQVQRRPWILSRSGTSGTQRYGAAMWSGDIGSNLTSLTTHLNAQMHMSFSGMDYFGSDIGGFHREAVQGDKNEMYTQWFAVGTLLDVPVRVHTFNLENKEETAPDRVGDQASNLYNLRQRYALNPYYYSLAHLAYEKGEPLFAPLAFHFQNDLNARKLGDHKMIGPNLLGVTISRHGQKAVDVYLPKGDWYDFHNGKMISSAGEWQKGVSALEGKIFRLPLYARGGAIFPMAHVTEATRSTSGDDPQLRVFPSTQASQFTLYEDDGESIAYKSGAKRLTKIEQSTSDNKVVISVHPGQGSYPAPQTKSFWLEVAMTKPTKVVHNNQELPPVKSLAELDKAARGWTTNDQGFVIAKTPALRSDQENTWEFSK